MSHPSDGYKPPKRTLWQLVLPVVPVWVPLLSALVYIGIAQVPLTGLAPILVLASFVGSCLTALILHILSKPQAAPEPPAPPQDTPPDPAGIRSAELLAALEAQLKNGGTQVQLSETWQQLEALLPQLAPNAQRLLCLQILQTYLHCTVKAEDAPIGEAAVTSAGNQQLFRMIRHTITNLSSPNSDPEANTGSEMQAILLDYVDQNCLDSALCLNSAADYLNTSIYAVSRIFKDATGVGFKEYITAKRLQYACHLLETTRKTISAVAAESGFENSTYFTTVFKNEYGIPPSKYRAKAQRAPEAAGS